MVATTTADSEVLRVDVMGKGTDPSLKLVGVSAPGLLGGCPRLLGQRRARAAIEYCGARIQH